MSAFKTLFSALALTLLTIHEIKAQQTCDGQFVAQAGDILSRYPKAFTRADIMPGDSEAQELFDAIMATKAPELLITPSNLTAGVPPSAADIARKKNDCWWTDTRCTTPTSPDLKPDFTMCPSPSTWGLSIDDGPTCYHTALYDMLKQQNLLASLYQIGSQILSYPLETQRGFLDGHQICVHTWSHPLMTSLTSSEIFAELYYTKKLLKEVTGYSSRCARMPYGDVDNRVRFFTQALDMTMHQWSDDSDDWQVATKGYQQVLTNYQNIINKPHDSSGIIVLSHEVNAATNAILIQELPKIQAAFQHITPVSTCENETIVYAEDNAPKFVDFADYANGQRGDTRTNEAFWTRDEIVYVRQLLPPDISLRDTQMGNGTAATFFSDDKSAPANSTVASSSSTIASQAAAPTRASTLKQSQPEADAVSAATAFKPSIIALVVSSIFVFL